MCVFNGEAKNTVHSKGTNKTHKPCKFCSLFHSWMAKVWNTNNNKRLVIDTADMKQILDQLEPRFKGNYAMHDAFEFLIDVLQKQLHNHLKVYGKDGKPQKMMRIAVITQPSADLDLRQLRKVSREVRIRLLASYGRSFFTERTWGQIMRQVKCHKCGKITIEFPHFRYIQLRLPEESELKAQKRKHVNLSELLATNQVPLKFYSWRCIHCGDKDLESAVSNNRQRLWKLPDVLYIRLCRVPINRRDRGQAKGGSASPAAGPYQNERQKKNITRVRFPLALNLKTLRDSPFAFCPSPFPKSHGEEKAENLAPTNAASCSKTEQKDVISGGKDDTSNSNNRNRDPHNGKEEVGDTEVQNDQRRDRRASGGSAIISNEKLDDAAADGFEGHTGDATSSSIEQSKNDNNSKEERTEKEIKTLELTSPKSPSTPATSSGSRFELFSVICHMNRSRSTNRGHYVAHIKNSHDNLWYVYNDRTVRRSPSLTDTYESAYVLCYERAKGKKSDRNNKDHSKELNSPVSAPAACR